MAADTTPRLLIVDDDMSTTETFAQILTMEGYDVALADLPLLGWTRVTVRGEHGERLDLYRSRWPQGEAP